MTTFGYYKEFCEQFSDLEGNPRYSEEDYLGFKECADEWYVLGSGKGEFSKDVPLGDPKKIKVPLK